MSSSLIYVQEHNFSDHLTFSILPQNHKPLQIRIKISNYNLVSFLIWCNWIEWIKLVCTPSICNFTEENNKNSSGGFHDFCWIKFQFRSNGLLWTACIGERHRGIEWVVIFIVIYFPIFLYSEHRTEVRHQLLFTFWIDFQRVLEEQKMSNPGQDFLFNLRELSVYNDLQRKYSSSLRENIGKTFEKKTNILTLKVNS